MAGAIHTAPWARALLRSVWPAEFGDVRDYEAGILAIARLETGFARWKPGTCENSWNFGAQHVLPGSDAPGCDATDSRPDGTRYAQKFLVFESPEAGMLSLVRLVHSRRRTWAALATRNATELAIAMRADRYYEGYGATESERITGYETSLVSASTATARQLGDPSLALRKAPGSPLLGVVLVGVGLASLGAALWWARRERQVS